MSSFIYCKQSNNHRNIRSHSSLKSRQSVDEYRLDHISNIRIRFAHRAFNKSWSKSTISLSVRSMKTMATTLNRIQHKTLIFNLKMFLNNVMASCLQSVVVVHWMNAWPCSASLCPRHTYRGKTKTKLNQSHTSSSFIVVVVIHVHLGLIWLKVHTIWVMLNFRGFNAKFNLIANIVLTSFIPFPSIQSDWWCRWWIHVVLVSSMYLSSWCRRHRHQHCPHNLLATFSSSSSSSPSSTVVVIIVVPTNERNQSSQLNPTYSSGILLTLSMYGS